jgi:hypothetical protein
VGGGRKARAELAGQQKLFESEELRLTPSSEERLRRLSVLPNRPPTVREARAEEADRTMERLREWGADLARRFRLRFRALNAEVEGVNEHYGVCYEDGVIRIRLRHAVTGRLLKESSLVDTLCHELAHLRYFDHSPRFWSYYRGILNEARRLGYYRPGRPGPVPVQGALFDAVGEEGSVHE